MLELHREGAISLGVSSFRFDIMQLKSNHVSNPPVKKVSKSTARKATIFARTEG